MKKSSALPLFLLLIIFLFAVKEIQASAFSEAYLRLNSNKTNANLSGTVCASPSSAGAGTENKIAITFPDSFTISSNPLDISTSTSNIPSTSTAWPGISTNAISISGKTVTFASSDLTNGSALYCFKLSSDGSTTGAIGSQTGFITTLNSSDAEIDRVQYAVSIVSNDQITVSALVPADPLDFTHSITQLTPGGHFQPYTQIQYQINYSSLLSYNTTLAVEASWSQGTVDGDSVPSVDIVNYVSGSATNAYNSTPPVIDTVNRTITWTINSFPGGLDQFVKFRLIARGDYEGEVRVAFTVSGRLLPPGTATSYDSITNYFSPGNLHPSSAPSQETTTTTTTTTTAPAIPAKTQEELSINEISINSISSNEASVYVSTNDLTSIQLFYGKSINSLTQKLSSLNSTDHLIKIGNLDPDTKYYFRVYATDSKGRKIISDIYTFKTAKTSTPLLADTYSLVASSDNTIISPLVKGDNNLILPVDSVFQIKFAMNDRLSAENIQTDLVNENVLGIFDFPYNKNVIGQSVNMIETQSGIYSGNLKAFENPGKYYLVAKISDKNGNISEQIIANIKVIDKFTVLSRENKEPIEGARVFLYLFSPSSKTYQPIPSSALSSGNPIYTDSNGELNLYFRRENTELKYTDLRHAEAKVDFEIGPGKKPEISFSRA